MSDKTISEAENSRLIIYEEYEIDGKTHRSDRSVFENKTIDDLLNQAKQAGETRVLEKVSTIIEKYRKYNFPFEDETEEIKPLQDEINQLLKQRKVK